MTKKCYICKEEEIPEERDVCDCCINNVLSKRRKQLNQMEDSENNVD
jgi:hypothetical protein